VSLIRRLLCNYETANRVSDATSSADPPGVCTIMKRYAQPSANVCFENDFDSMYSNQLGACGEGSSSLRQPAPRGVVGKGSKQTEHCVISTFQVAESTGLQGRIQAVEAPTAGWRLKVNPLIHKRKIGFVSCSTFQNSVRLAKIPAKRKYGWHYRIGNCLPSC
jgi:hypothetical protein